MGYFLGFRQYLNTEKSFNDLEKIINESNFHFKNLNGINIVVALCGEEPEEYLRKYNLLDKVHFIKADKLKPGCINILYYSNQKEGLTKPCKLLLELAKKYDAKLLGISDSDFQIPYSATKRAFEEAIDNISNEHIATVYLPTRSHRSLELRGYFLDRFALEDLENAFFWYFQQDKPAEELDIQSGLQFVNKEAITKIDLTNSGLWTGSIDIVFQVANMGAGLKKGIVVDTNSQNESSIDLETQFKKISELEKIYSQNLETIADFVITNPRFLMEDWSGHLTKQQTEGVIYNIVSYYKFNKDKK